MPIRRILVLLAAGACLCAFPAYGQEDSPSLGDVARQARLQKQQKDAQSPSTPGKDAPTPTDQDKAGQPKADQTKADGTKNSSSASATPKNAKPSHVVTNDEVPSHIGSTLTSAKGSQPANTTDEQPGSENSSAGDQWKSQIQAQKAAVAQLQSDIATVSDSIQYAGANCVSNCVQWNEEQKRKQDQVETMKAALEEQQKRLEDLQESARKRGFGSSVYDPE
jgi:hypothetical protein